MQLVARLVAISITRELGPLITAIVVIGRSGSAFAAEIGTMRVTEELDALKTMALDPVAFLVVPKFLAMAVMLPCLAIWADLMGVLGGSLFGVVGGGFTFGGYMLATRDALLLRDITSGVIKSLVFGMVITAVGCHEGLLHRRRRGRGGPLHHVGRRHLHSAGDPDRPGLYRPVLPGAGGALRWRTPAADPDHLGARSARALWRPRGSARPHVRSAARRDAGGDRRLRLGQEHPAADSGGPREASSGDRCGSRAWTSPRPAPARWTPSASASAWLSRAAL